MLTFSDQAYHLYQDSIAAHSSWLSTKNSSSAASWEAVGTRVLMGYQDAVQRMSQRISQTSTNYDMYGIVVAIVSLSMVSAGSCGSCRLQVKCSIRELSISNREGRQVVVPVVEEIRILILI